MTDDQKQEQIKLFERFLKYKFAVFYKEVPFTKLMKTDRIFRADYFVRPDIIIEINGGSWMIKGRHNFGTGYARDIYKINLAQYHGFKVFQFTYECLKHGYYRHFIK